MPGSALSACALRLERRAVVDERRAVLATEREQLVAALLPPLASQRR